MTIGCLVGQKGTARTDTDRYSFPYVSSWAPGDSDRVVPPPTPASAVPRRILRDPDLTGSDEQEAAA